MIESILFLIGVIAGMTGSLVGLGGGMIIVPSLIGLSEMSSKLISLTHTMAVGTSIALIFLGATSSTLSYIKQKRIHYRKGFLFFIGCSPGFVLGSNMTVYIRQDLFFISFGIMMITITFLLQAKRKLSFRKRELSSSLLFFLSLVIGVLSSIFGIGGGVFLLPLMILSGIPVHIATATSMFVIFLSSFSGAMTHLFSQNICWYAVLFLGPGMVIGGWIGANISSKINSETLFRCIRLLIFLVAITFIVKGTGIFSS